MNIIPNELKININTTIPGFQKITYLPSMTIKNISKNDKKVYFNPLVKLNKSLIEKIPESFRIKEFFSENLFQSLLNYMKQYPVKNLNQATFKGIVDNNIEITLSTIFPENSVIYISGNSYVIVDYQWNIGDWKMNVINKDSLKSFKELNKLPNSVIYGKNYDGLINQKGGFKNNNPYISNTSAYNPYYPPYYPPYNPYYPPYKNKKKFEDKDKAELAYFINIDMELHPGETISLDEKKKYKCVNKWNKVRKSYSIFTGKPYIIPPIYPKKTIKTIKNKNNSNRFTRKLRN